MTTELEKKFFETFGIKPYKTPSREYDSDGKICSYYIEYPQITDRMWLELVRIYASCNIFLLRKNMEDFKYDILTGLIERPYEYR